MNEDKKPVSFQKMMTGKDEGDRDWKATVDWTKVFNSLIFAFMVVAVALIWAIAAN